MSSPIPRAARALVALVGVLSAAACSVSVERLRDEAADAYFQGDATIAAAKLDEAIASHLSGDVQSGVKPETWDREARDSSLLAMERASVALRAGDPDAAAAILRRFDDEFASRRIDSLTEFLGINGFQTVSQVLLGDGELTYPSIEFEELAARTMLTLAVLVGDRAGRIPVALRIGSAQREMLGHDFGASELNPDRIVLEQNVQHETLGLAHYLAGVVLEAEPNQAPSTPYESAKAALGDVRLVDDAIERMGPPRQGRSDPGSAVVHVFYLLGRGPKFGSTRFTFRDGDPIAEGLIRLVTLAIDYLRSTDDKGESAFTRGLRQQITQAPIAVPKLLEIDRRVRQPSGPVAAGAGPEGAWTVQGRPEVLTDFHDMARRGLEQMRWVRITRALVRRALKELAVQEIKDDLWRDIARLAGTLIEDADTRNWQLLPAEVQVARLTPLLGECTVDLGLPGVGPVPLVTGSSYDSFVVVIDTGAVGSVPTVLVDRLSSVNP